MREMEIGEDGRKGALRPQLSLTAERLTIPPQDQTFRFKAVKRVEEDSEIRTLLAFKMQ
jgi:hypothetical protein